MPFPSSALSRRLSALGASTSGLRALAGARRGVEREALRVRANGQLATTPHPRALGSALTHPSITTDFSESLLELVSVPHASVDGLLDELDELHRYVCGCLDGELLWTASMPCALGDDERIPIAEYGRSNPARMKAVYRSGLYHRYGPRMQMVSGIHYNFSLPEAFWEGHRERLGSRLAMRAFVDDCYFGLLRNFQRVRWLPIYLFGASPMVCSSFVRGRRHHLERLSAETFGLAHATSLRMGALGYQSAAQQRLFIAPNSLAEYVGAMRDAIMTPYPPYQRIGVRAVRGWRQLNDGVLQIENEYYNTVRPKRPTRPGETPCHALCDRGVQYVELRLIDVDPFCALGIDQDAARFLEALLCRCLLADSPPSTPAEARRDAANQAAVVDRGRQPGLALADGARARPLAAWARALLDEVDEVAECLDAAHGTARYREACRRQRDKVEEPERTPSAAVASAVADADAEFGEWALAMSRRHTQAFLDAPTSAPALAREAERSLRRQHEIERADAVSFDAYRAAFYRQYDACCERLLAGQSCACA